MQTRLRTDPSGSRPCRGGTHSERPALRCGTGQHLPPGRASSGALDHHFSSSTAELTAAVYEQAHERVVALMDEAFEEPVEDVGAPPGRPVRGVAHGGTGPGRTQLAVDGCGAGSRDDVLALVRRRVVDAHRDVVPAPEDLAELAVVVAAGLESLGHTDAEWWGPQDVQAAVGVVAPVVLVGRGGAG